MLPISIGNFIEEGEINVDMNNDCVEFSESPWIKDSLYDSCQMKG